MKRVLLSVHITIHFNPLGIWFASESGLNWISHLHYNEQSHSRHKKENQIEEANK